MVSKGVEHDIVKLLYSEDSSPSEVALASSILHSRGDWDSGAKHVMQSEEGTCGLREWALLQQVIASCSEAVLCKHYKNWTSLLTQALKVNKDEVIHRHLCEGVSSLMERAHQSSKAMPDFAKQKVPLLLQALQCYSTAGRSVQLVALQAAAACQARFPVGQSQLRTALVNWGKAAVFDPHTSLSLQGARLMALLCHHSNQKWVCLVDSAVAALDWTLEQFFSPGKKPPMGKSSQLSSEPLLEISSSSLPQSEPQRTSYLFQLVDQLTRALSVSLLLPPTERAHLPSVPVERILCTVLRGLGQRPPQGHTVECQAMAAGLPILRTSLWNVLCVLLRTCHAHLLQYARFIRSLLVEEISSREVQLSPLLLASVYRAVSLWVGVAKDSSPAVINPILQSLTCGHTPSSARCLRLQVLCEVIESVGPALDSSLPFLSAIRQLPFENITPGTPKEEVLLWLRLLGACVHSRGALSPPYGPVLQLLSDLTQSNPDKQIQTTSANILSQCNFLMHPSVPPLPNPVSSSTAINSSLPHSSLPSSEPRPPSLEAFHSQAQDEQRNLQLLTTARLCHPLPPSSIGSSSVPAVSAGNGDLSGFGHNKRRRIDSCGNGTEEDIKRAKRKVDPASDVVERIISGRTNINAANSDAGDNSGLEEMQQGVDRGASDGVQGLGGSPHTDSEDSPVDVGGIEEVQVEKDHFNTGPSDAGAGLVVVDDDDNNCSESDGEDAVSGTELFVDESSDESDSQE